MTKNKETPEINNKAGLHEVRIESAEAPAANFSAGESVAVTPSAEAELSGDTAGKSEKKTMSRLRSFFFNRRAQKDFNKEEKELHSEVKEKAEKSAKDNRKLNEYLHAIESQLGKVDEQNQILLSHLNTVKENNEVLLEQIKILTANNSRLSKDFQVSKKRERIAKIFAIISATLAIGLSVYNILKIIFS